MTEHDARELSVAAVGLGATDFYHKPLDAGVLSIVVRRALRIRELEEENWRLRERTGAMALEGVIGVSDTMRGVCRAIEKDRKSTRLNSSHLVISYAVFCLTKK